MGGPTKMLIPVLMALGALSASVMGATVATVLGGAVIGLVWASLLAWLWSRVHDTRRAADRAVAVAAFVATMLFGGSTFAMLAYAASLGTAPAILAFIAPPIGGGFAFFVMANTSLEWILLPSTIHLTWQQPGRRRLIVTGALLYYAARAATYLHFAPTIMATGEAAALDPDAVDLAGVRMWVFLSIPRWVIDGILAGLLLVAVPPQGTGFPSKSGN
jgi:hypothetical protein